MLEWLGFGDFALRLLIVHLWFVVMIAFFLLGLLRVLFICWFTRFVASCVLDLAGVFTLIVVVLSGIVNFLVYWLLVLIVWLGVVFVVVACFMLLCM